MDVIHVTNGVIMLLNSLISIEVLIVLSDNIPYTCVSSLVGWLHGL